MKTIELPTLGITVKVDDEGNGTLTGRLNVLDRPSNIEGGSEEDTCWDRYDGMIGGIETVIIEHACAGIDITDPRYVLGIENAINDAAYHNLQ